MKYKLITSSSTDFEDIKKDAFRGVIFPFEYAAEERLKCAKKNSLKRLIHLRNLEKVACSCISESGAYEGTVYCVTVKSAQNSVLQIKELISQIDGFVIPFPCVSGLLWDDAFCAEYGKFCGEDLYKELPMLFDSEKEAANVRIWYYKRASDKVFSEFVLPVSDYIKSLGKTVYFDLGDMSKGHYAIRKLIVPSLFDKAGIRVIREEKDGQYISQKRGGEDVLLVTPLRGIMQMYAWDTKLTKEESGFSLAVCEEEYYRNSLEKCGLSVYATDEFALSQMREGALRQFGDVLIQKSCLVENGKAEKLQGMGIKINDAKLLEMMDKVN